MLDGNSGTWDAKQRIDLLLKPAYESSSNNSNVLSENILSLTDRKAGPNDIRYVKGLQVHSHFLGPMK